MSNEELVYKIQQGSVELLADLWENVFRLVHLRAAKFCETTRGRGGLEVEDLEQIGFLAMLEAVETYRPDMAARFTTWLCIYLRRHFQDASGRLYVDQAGEQRPKDALNCAISLNIPVAEDDPCELQDLIADPIPAADIMEDRVWAQQLRTAVENVLQRLPKDQRKALQLRYLDNCTVEDAATQMQTTPTAMRTLIDNAVKTVRRTKAGSYLRTFVDFSFYTGTGLGAYKSTGASIQERYLMRKENKIPR